MSLGWLRMSPIVRILYEARRGMKTDTKTDRCYDLKHEEIERLRRKRAVLPEMHFARAEHAGLYAFGRMQEGLGLSKLRFS